MTTSLEQLELLYSPRFKRRTRRSGIEDKAAEIAELVAMREYAEGNDVFTDSQRRDLDQRISRFRHAILSELTISELRALKDKSLMPEQASRILVDEAPPSEEVKKLQKEVWAAYAAEMSARSYFVASKVSNFSISPGVSLESIAADWRTEGLEKFTLPAMKKIETATAADAFLNHIIERKTT